MGRKEAREGNFQPAQQLLAVCRTGDTLNNGYNLWVHASIYHENGGRWNGLGTTRQEVKTFLVQDLRTWIQELRENQGDPKRRHFSLMILDACFLGDGATDPIPHRKLGTTPEEFESFMHARS